jgi:hypothetical protein
VAFVASIKALGFSKNGLLENQIINTSISKNRFMQSQFLDDLFLKRDKRISAQDFFGGEDFG